MTGTIDALGGGTYVVSHGRSRFVAASVVTDATADGTLQTSHRATCTSLRLHGYGVPRSRLALRTAGRPRVSQPRLDAGA
jgi:hypothetical protein